MSSIVEQRLESTRKELLDLGLRNPLINFRSRKTSIEVVDELSVEVFRLLVKENKNLSFASLPQKAFASIGDDDESEGEIDAIDWDELLGEEEDLTNEVASRHRDTRLQTGLRPETLLKRLLQIHYQAKTAIEEQGINILYLACGFLYWYEAEQSDILHKAPLCLIPVELNRLNAKASFRINYNLEELSTNLSLQEKLQADFKIKFPDLPSADDLDTRSYFESVSQAIRDTNRWKIQSDEIHLGFFSFNKLLMYRDLDAKIWNEDKKPTKHSVIRSLFSEGLVDPGPALSEHVSVDELVQPADYKQVVDADSSQVLALLEVRRGKNLVVQGPPGTGKSQTITNAIGQALAEGKKVLFVSEKMAALEVVKRRLDNIGLGDTVLELHSNKTRKKDLLSEISRTLHLGEPRVQVSLDELKSLSAMRDLLNAYCKAANSPVAPSNLTPVTLVGLCDKLRQDNQELPLLADPILRKWNDGEFKLQRQRISELQALLSETGTPTRNAFWGTQIESILPREETNIRGQIDQSCDIMESLNARVTDLSSNLCINVPVTLGDISVLCRAAMRAAEAPHLEGMKLKSGEWQSKRDEIKILLVTGASLSQLHAAWDDLLIESAWKQEVLKERTILATTGYRWWRLLSSSYRNARDRMAGLCRGRFPKDPDERIHMVDAILSFQEKNDRFQQLESLGKELFGAQWQGTDSDWPVLEKVAQWVIDLYDSIGDGEIPIGILDFLSGAKRLLQFEPMTRSVQEELQSLRSALNTIASSLGFHEKLQKNLIADDKKRDELHDWLACLSNRSHDLRGLVQFNLHRSELLRLELHTVASACENWDSSRHSLLQAFDLSRYQILLDMAMAERKELRDFSRIQHEQRIGEFRRLDSRVFELNRNLLIKKHFREIPHIGTGGGELGVIRHEINKSRRHIPIRQLIAQSWRALQAIKPVFMMSPLSIANYLPPNSIEFDLVVFDEASQVRPVDALGAILRAKQVVVVGDNQQLPPTRFFDNLENGDDETNVTSDLESILGLFCARGFASRMLQWHYRSRHDSLIAVSNHEFYDNRLVVFPSPGSDDNSQGLIFRYLPDTEYERGERARNLGEAHEVAKEIMYHAHNCPDLSLGVAAFSMSQREAIELQLEAMRRQDETVESFFSDHKDEPFFIKNLESVQGDERDVIIISIGYGFDRNKHFTMNFGPLNNDGGERRLNVLITRAKKTCFVFSNITADNIDLTRARSRGVRSLKTFLNYAANRVIDIKAPTHGEVESEFERQVLGALTNLGYDAQSQIGTAGFRIDIGIVDDELRGRYILGIECDGATYHSARSARDRDRLREQVLRGLGWRLHRVWSTDWFRNPQQELRRIVEAVERAKTSSMRKGAKAQSENDGARTSQDMVQRTIHGKQVTEATSNRAYVTSSHTFPLKGQEFHDLNRLFLAQQLSRILSEEGPLHLDTAIIRLTQAAGLRRAGNRIRTAILECVDAGEAQGLLECRDEFVWQRNQAITYPRDRSYLEPSMKRMELVPPEEIELSLTLVIGDSFSIAKADAITASGRLLGFQHITDSMAGTIKKTLDALIRAGKVKDSVGTLTLVK